MNETKSVETFWLGQALKVADGTYGGTWGGYYVTMKVDDVTVHFKTEAGIKGINVPVLVTVKNGQATVTTL